MSMGKKLVLKYIRAKFKLLASISKRKAAEKAFELFVTPQSRVKKNLPPVFEKAEKLNFNYNNIPIAGYRWNHPKEKKLLILHGFESSAVNFDKFINPLVKKGYEVLAFDAPAHGRSGGSQIHAVIYKEFIRYILETYGPVKNFITHSFGGLALSLALEEMPHDESYHVVFIAPATESTTAMDRFFDIVQLDDEVRKEFDKVITEANNQSPSWYSVARAAEKIKARVLFLQDKDDPLTPLSDVEPIIQKKYQNFSFVITEGLGHRRIYRDASQVKRIIEFFK
jgi:pimeloyl-ACP methyl ester carboxylesterase